MSSLDPSDHEPAALLSDNALAALQLREQPFLRPENPADTFSDDITTDQLADIKQALITGDDLLLILGDSGIGKTTLLSQLGENSGLRIQCFSVQGSARFSTVNLFGGMLEAFKREPPDNLKTMLDELVPCLQGMISNNTLSAVVIDDADTVDALEMTRLLSAMLYINGQDETLMRIALAAPRSFEERIPELLPEGADLPYSTLTVEAFDHQRAAHYLGWRLERVCDAPSIPFDEAQIVQLNEDAGGNPRKLHELVADELNARHGELEPAIPPELLSSSRDGNASLAASLLGGRSPKILLGALGVLLIGLGLLSFLPGGDSTDDEDSVVEQRRLEEENADRLALVEEKRATENRESQPTDSERAASSSSGADDSTAPGQADEASDIVIVEDSDSRDGSAASVDAGVSSDPQDQSDAVPGESAELQGADSEAPVESNSDDSSGADDASAPASGSDGDSAAQETNEDAAAESDTSEDDAATVPETTPSPIPDSDVAETSERLPSADSPDAETESESEAEPSDGVTDDTAAEDGQAQSQAESRTESQTESQAERQVDTQAARQSDGQSDVQEPSDAERSASQDVAAAESDDAESTPESTTGSSTASAPSPVSDPSSPLSGGLESPNWILVQNPDLYTIQMIASTSRGEVEAFLVEASLSGPNSIFTFQRSGVDWYALVHGLYGSVEEARSAIIRMPDAALSFQPWIRSIGRVQNSLRQ